MPLSVLARHGALGPVLVLAAVFDLVAIGWGLPASWAPDELGPRDLVVAMAMRFSDGWSHAYPPLQFWLLSALSWPVTASAAETIEIGAPAYTTLSYVMRLTSVAMGLGSLGLVYAIGCELYDRRAAVMATLIVALSPTFIYYSKVANVDVPYVFWFVLSVWLFVRILARHRTRDYALFGAAAALAVCTKDQAYGLYVLAPFVIALSYSRDRRGVEPAAGVWASLVRGPMLLAVGVGGLVFSVVHNLAFNPDGFIEHVRTLLGPRSSAYQMFPNTVTGHLQLLWLSVGSLAFVLGWLPFGMCIAGLASAIWQRASNRRLLATLVFPVSYYLFFVSVVLYQYDRFALPMALVLALFGGKALSACLVRGAPLRWARVAAVAALFVWRLLPGVALDARMLNDARYCAAAWVERNAPAGAFIIGIGLHTDFPVLPAHSLATVDERNFDQIWRGELVLTSSLFQEDRFGGHRDAVERFVALRSGRSQHQLAKVCEPMRGFDFLRTAGIPTNLDKIDPEIRIYRRAP